jgi:hypothetical protein
MNTTTDIRGTDEAMITHVEWIELSAAGASSVGGK